VSGLKNVVRVKAAKHGHITWLLLDKAGMPIEAFSYYCEKNRDFAVSTQKRYAEVVSRFIDYLIEADAFGVPTTKKHLNAVIDAYPLLLRDGSIGLEERLRRTISDNPEDEWLLRVAQSLNQQPLRPASFSNTLAAINRFLRLSEALAIEAFEKATLAGITHNESYKDLIKALSGATKLSAVEVRNMRHNSVLGSVIRFKSEGLTRPRRLSTSATVTQVDIHHLDFPMEFVIPLAHSATSYRDRALWLLLAASGIRVSEALNLQWADINPETQEVFIYDPAGRRLGGDMTPDERARFKGRTVSMTYLIQPFRQAFFRALEDYVRHEFVPGRTTSSSGFVFQYIEPSRRGQPLRGVSDAALTGNFKAASEKAGVPTVSSRQWTIHSLRHMYGVYMVNDFPVDPASGKYGLELAEVQVLMGHRSINSTRHYARKKRRVLEHKLRQADERLLGLADAELLQLPSATGGFTGD